MNTSSKETTLQSRVRWVMALYLLGVFMGALDTGIVTPARAVIEQQFGIDPKLGVWIITIYTLAYTASIPVMGKLADRLGRKNIYLLSIALFGLGSLLSGLSQDFASFPMLIVSRAIQALGGGGIVPIANAEFGTSVPKEKRGMALGMVGMVYGVANIFGASAGSLILSLVGTENWQWIFYINVPISIAIVAGGLAFLPNTKTETRQRIDLAGITVLTAMILSLLLGLRGIDYFNLQQSLTDTAVYPFLLAFLVLLPVFILVERRAKDPALNLHFFTSGPVLVTLLTAFISGVVMMGVVFIPQFAETATRVATGSGGYFVIVLGLFSGIGAPLSGSLTDKYGPKAVLSFGFSATVLAMAMLLWWAIPHPSTLSVLVSLACIGFGLGFVMGSPLNYMMLEHTKHSEANSALATLSMVRSIGSTIAPAAMAGFLSQAAAGIMPAMTKGLSKAELGHLMSTMPNMSSMKTMDLSAMPPRIADIVQTQMNLGFANIFITVAVVSILALLILAAYPRRKHLAIAEVLEAVDGIDGFGEVDGINAANSIDQVDANATLTPKTLTVSTTTLDQTTAGS